MKHTIGVFLCLFIFHSLTFAQENLSLTSAIETTLKNNYFIQISRNSNEISKNNNSLGNAGFLPSLDLNATISNSRNNTKQKYSNGNEVNSNNASTDNINAGARVTWTLFDGLKMFAAKSRLGLTEEASTIQLKIAI